jgi:hypothetical protein
MPYIRETLLEMQMDSLQPVFPILDKTSARQHYLCKRVDASDLATVKISYSFTSLQAAARSTRAEELTTNLVNAFAEWFFAGFTRFTGTPTDEADRSEVYNVSTFP